MSQKINNNRDLELFAKDLAQDRAAAESLLWHYALKSGKMNGYSFRRLQPVGELKVNFICQRLNLIIEIHGSTPISKSQSDKEREAGLRQLGYSVLSFSESEVVMGPGQVADQIRTVIQGLC